MTTCPQCGMESHHPADEKHGWCSNCNEFYYAMRNSQPIYLDAIISELQASVRPRIADGTPFSLQFEQFTKDEKTYWRAIIKMGTVVWRYSDKPQVTPTDALRELSEIVSNPCP